MTDEPNQPLQTSSLSGFGGLDGIEPPRDVQPSHTNKTLDRLIKVGEKVIKEYEEKYIDNVKIDGMSYQYYLKIKEQELGDISFGENDLTAYILTTMFDEYPYYFGPLVHGYYTGYLLSVLTERNAAQGKPTRFYINGNGNRFNYLFYGAHFVDELIVENFSGNSICWNLKNHKTGIKRVVGINVNGMHAFAKCGQNSSIRQFVLLNCSGMSPAVELKNIDQVIAVNIKGEQNYYDDGALSKFDRINQLIAVGISGNMPLRHSNGYKYNQIIIQDMLGEDVMYEEPYLNHTYNLKSTLIYGNVPHLYEQVRLGIQIPIEELQIAQLSHSPQSQAPQGVAQHPLLGISLSQILQCGVNPDKVEETLRLARSMQGKPYQEVLRIADELYALRPAVPEGFFERK